MLPTDSLTLVAGPYVTATRTVKGVTLSTFFYEQDAALTAIKSAYNIGFRHSLADIIELNTPTNVLDDVFHAAS